MVTIIIPILLIKKLRHKEDVTKITQLASGRAWPQTQNWLSLKSMLFPVVSVVSWKRGVARFVCGIRVFEKEVKTAAHWSLPTRVLRYLCDCQSHFYRRPGT